MPRVNSAEARRTRSTIVTQAMQRASIDGFDGVTLGSLADDLGLSKAGVVGPFGSKEALQVEALAESARIFTARVWAPVADEPPGRQRLLAVMERWIAYLLDCPFPGGCLLTTASIEYDAQSGSMHEQVAELVRRWHAALHSDAEVAARSGELPAESGDPAEIAFQLYGIALMLNQSVVLFGDRTAAAHAAWTAVTRLLGSSANITPS